MCLPNFAISYYSTLPALTWESAQDSHIPKVANQVQLLTATTEKYIPWGHYMSSLGTTINFAIAFIHMLFILSISFCCAEIVW